jgi:CheY-like chemotaxis protein
VVKGSAEHGIVTITDSGAGIAPELLPRVFDLFVQSDRTLDRSEGGVGIGLALVRRLVEMHGGEVSASSPGIGLGSTFEIRLPRVAPAVARLEEAVDAGLSGKRVLIVDDNADAADALAMSLVLDGYTAEAVYSAQRAIERVTTFRPDAVVLDIGLPELNGYEVARRLRELPALNETRLIALTGYGQAEHRRLSREAGFDEHLVKPVDLDVLRRAL